MSAGQQWWADHERTECSGADCWCNMYGAQRDLGDLPPPQALYFAPKPAPVAAPRLRILCDADGVLVDFVGLVLDYVQKNTGLSYLPSAIDKWDCFAALGLQEHWPYFREQCDRLQLCRSMRPMLGADRFLAELRRRGEVAICTTPMTPGWLTQRAEWLVEFGVPLKHQIHTHCKDELAGSWDILIDDNVGNVADFWAAGGKAFLISAPYNGHASATYPRGDWRACLAWLDGILSGQGEL
jgi:5'(3')-deoxyribonucleotidase